MPVLETFAVPASANLLELPDNPDASIFIAFVSGKDLNTKLPWCPDVRAALPHLTTAFTAEDAPTLVIVEVGKIPEWRDPKNAYRTNWAVNNIPTLARYQRVNGVVSETGRLVEGQILDKDGLRKFIWP
ncbi:hypothetical protein N7492_008257 [Penicillium capsulatum]|uniref:Thioredoxin domain-containing protein n=1 Tax=Penicillium capsulatum TaxID=69766 RepID=A0A9W9HS99_9EURO|nr:hypothetical protein N7492_008257 [Penicillium capsulatum]KAJ6105666.1 hypothetical protein N7512_009183 [Penicillium capsulatum]